MNTRKSETYLEPDDAARDLARGLISQARFGALGVMIDGAPFVSRIALAPGDGVLTTLISDLAPHTAALRAAPKASLLIGEPGKGDPLAHPRLTLQVTGIFLEKSEHEVEAYLTKQPKAGLYVGFGDFHLVSLEPEEAWLNGGFGKAYRLTPTDLISRDA